MMWTVKSLFNVYFAQLSPPAGYVGSPLYAPHNNMFARKGVGLSYTKLPLYSTQYTDNA